MRQRTSLRGAAPSDRSGPSTQVGHEYLNERVTAALQESFRAEPGAIGDTPLSQSRATMESEGVLSATQCGETDKREAVLFATASASRKDRRSAGGPITIVLLLVAVAAAAAAVAVASPNGISMAVLVQASPHGPVVDASATPVNSTGARQWSEQAFASCCRCRSILREDPPSADAQHGACTYDLRGPAAAAVA